MYYYDDDVGSAATHCVPAGERRQLHRREAQAVLRVDDGRVWDESACRHFVHPGEDPHGCLVFKRVFCKTYWYSYSY